MMSLRPLIALALMAGGALGLISGVALSVMTGVASLSMSGEVISTWISYVSILAEPNPRPMPSLNAFWPSVGLIAGVSLFLGSWVAIIRGAAHAWPARFDRSLR